MSTAWLPYLPEHLARAIAARPDALQIGRARRVHAVALFADVSGFTPMSEALARTGRRGAEDLTLILNRYFTRMIALLHDYGGIVCKFGGDALTVIFPYHVRARGSVTRRAVTCAHAMQAAMPDYAAIPTSAGTFGLAMKIGIARGSLLSMTAGDTDRLEYILAGGPLDRCADAEHHADKGEIVVDDQLLDDLGSLSVLNSATDSAVLGACCGRRGRVPARPLPEISAAAAAVYTRYMHPAIAQRIAAGQAGFINEHRQVSVLFVNFSGFDYDADPQAGARLQAYLCEVFAVVAALRWLGKSGGHGRQGQQVYRAVWRTDRARGRLGARRQLRAGAAGAAGGCAGRHHHRLRLLRPGGRARSPDLHRDGRCGRIWPRA